MAEPLSLPGIPPPPPSPTVDEGLSRDARRTARQRQQAEAGVNPYAGTSGPEGSSCGTCVHVRRVDWHRRRYLKCGLDEGQWTHGPGTDLRLWWPGCHRWAG